MVKLLSKNKLEHNVNSKFILAASVLVAILIVSGCTQASYNKAGTTNTQAPIQTPPATQAAPNLASETPKVQENNLSQLINGRTVDGRLKAAYSNLHASGSGPYIYANFPDIQLTYTDAAAGKSYPQQILPFRYYYSKEANTTFSICNINSTVFICKGKIAQLISDRDLNSGNCVVAAAYTSGSAYSSGSQQYP